MENTGGRFDLFGGMFEFVVGRAIRGFVNSGERKCDRVCLDDAWGREFAIGVAKN